ncbi:MAG: ATP-binding cassette domain-containing protein [Pseudomonadota bacterium]|nr:ATP-binding cassette domain-containing protein [Pseudomonadota bacterium]
MSLVLDGLAISLHGEKFVAPFSMEIADGEIVTLMGPSGSGKSTILQAIAGGLAAPFALTGRIYVNGIDVSQVDAAKRRIGRLFQDDLLFPHLTVGENLMFGMARGRREQRLALMRDALSDIELDGTEHRAPHTLSGGQRQRVALMRSLLAGPDAMLLDEPFSKLDETLRAAMRELTFANLLKRGTPTLIVTHDKADAPKHLRIFKIENGEVINVR